MQILVMILLVLFFFAYPTWGIFKQQIALKGVTIYRDQTPLTFWCTAGFLYFCGIVFTFIIWRLPFAEILMPMMIVFIIIYAIIYFLKL